MKQNKNIQTLPIESLPGYSVDETLDPGMAELTTYIPGQAEPLVVRGDAELLREDFRRQVAAEAKRPAAKPAEKPVEVPRTAPEPKDGPIDYSELSGRQLARLKVKAQFYDMFHRTDMYGLLTERINEDRDVAFAAKLGLLSLSETYCRKHQKAVAKLRGMDLTR